jgi:hypothetical protein
MTAELYEWARDQARLSGVSLGRYLALLVEERKSGVFQEEEAGAAGANASKER